MSTRKDEFYNWVQNVLAINITKAALHKHVINKWEEEIRKCRMKSLDDLTQFLSEVEDGNGTLIKSDKSKNLECVDSHEVCMRMLDLLMKVRQNKSFRLNCRTILGRKIVKNEVMESDAALMYKYITAKSDMTTRADKPKPPDNYSQIFPGCKITHIWCIANMFMKSGKFRNDICNTCPADTDAAMFFRMMKNCNLFELDCDEDLYQEVIDIRNKLHHSSVMIVKKQESEDNLDTLKKLLELFSTDECNKAISEIVKVEHQTHYLGNIKKAIFLKALALETDRKIEEGKGYYSEETRELQVEALEHFKYTSLEQFLTIKSKGNLKRENDSYQQQFRDLTIEYTYTELDDLQEELKGRTKKLEDSKDKIEDKLEIDKLLADTRHLRCELADLSQKRYKVTSVTKVRSSRDDNMQIVEKLREEIRETRKQISDLREEKEKEKKETDKPTGQYTDSDKSETVITFDPDDVEVFKDLSSIDPRREAAVLQEIKRQNKTPPAGRSEPQDNAKKAPTR